LYEAEVVCSVAAVFSTDALRHISIYIYNIRGVYRMTQEERSVFWEVTVSVILSKKMYIYMYPIPNGFRDRAISLCSFRIVDRKEILRKVKSKDIPVTGHRGP
jgi:hypothetical protein